ncbi:PilZ domain-containing protein [Thalassomonas sp. M1454]|uniref:PilZ domain-containing protein n=1 Tax=Thalassomonas sp. M1454 TaxID=2594477 RepID=UPI00117E2C9C|nr:PilZ domain-containing protein [Thalassomonas sp. M1454]TRX53133.1 PilZ domain-containing protein [Thalassomonas sp. M1454]
MSLERRFHPRFDIDLPITISFDNDDIVLAGNALNISLSGLQVEVGKNVTDSILKHCPHPPEFYISIKTEQLILEKIKLRMIINRRISQQKFQLGLKFISPSNEHLNTLNAFIQSCKTR